MFLTHFLFRTPRLQYALEANVGTSDAEEKTAAGEASPATASSASEEPQDAGAGAEAAMVARENNNDRDSVVAGHSASSQTAGKSVGSTLAAGGVAESVEEAMIGGLPRGLVKCPGCPMVS